MKGVRAIKIDSSFRLGSLVEFEVVFDEAPTAVYIKIYDSFTTVRVNNQALTGDSGGLFFTYVYQNEDATNFGEYLAIIKATYPSGDVYSEYTFEMQDPNPYARGGF